MTNTWMIVADAAGARLFEVDRGEIRLIQEKPNPKGRARAQEIVTDRPGRVLKGRGRNVLSSMEPRTPPHEVEERRFAQQLGEMLDDGFDRHAFGRLIFVAPPHFLGLLRSTLTNRVYQTVTASIERDYTKLDEHELREALAALKELPAEGGKRRRP